MSYNSIIRGLAVLVAFASLGATSAQTGAKNLNAKVKTVFEDGTVVLDIGGGLVPVRLDGVALLPGAYQALLAALPAGIRVRYQVVTKGPPATVVMWRSSVTMQEELLKKKLALKR